MAGELDTAKLLALCTKIQGNASRIPVRVKLDAEFKSKFLSELPAELAVWWAMHFVIRMLTLKEPPIDGEATDDD